MASNNGYTPSLKMSDSSDGDASGTRSLLRRAWNNENAVGTINGKKMVITPFRGVNNLGDFLARQNYICGGPNQLKSAKPGLKNRMGSILSSCDGSGVEGFSGNPKFVADSSDYIKYKKQVSMNANY